MEIGIVLLMLVAVLYLSWFIYRLGVGKRKREEERILIDALIEKDASEWTEDDRKLLLRNLERNRSLFTAQQYDILHAKYSGTISVTEMALKNGISPNQVNQMGGKNTTSAQKDGTKTIVKDAVIGGVIAGSTGAVVGAIVGKNKVDNESKNK